MSDVAGVYILEAPYHVDRIYHYHIPMELRDRVVPGTIVEVPFGNGNRRMTAAVYEITDSADKEDLKPISSAVDVCPPYLSNELLRLCAFLKSHTLCTFGDAVRCVLPPSAISRLSEYYVADSCLSESETEKAVEGLNEKSAFVYSAICAAKRASKDSLKAKFGADVPQILIKLVKAGLIRKCDEVKRGGENIKTVIFASATKEAKNEAYAAKIKSQRQREVLEAVLKAGRVSLDELEEESSLGRDLIRAQLQTLSKKGLVTLEKEEVYRNPVMPTKAELARYSGGYTLSAEQKAALDKLLEVYTDETPRAALLHGVTGSGKTNVIMSLIDRCLADRKSVIMLVPEIALTPQTVGRFLARYGDRVALIHSALSQGERFDAWRRIREGEADVVIGTRSAVFAPVSNLGLIVIDEEHEHTYKSDTNPKYQTHDVAGFRCKEHGAALVMASATPSVTSYYKATVGKYTLVELHSRFGGATLPEVELVNMRTELQSGNTSPLSRALTTRIGEEMSLGHQTILFLNRRGYNSCISCRSCGESVKCPHCSVTMTYHVNSGQSLPRDREAGEAYLDVRRNSGYLHCHMCGYKSRVPEKCPDCGESHFMFAGYGTQLAEDELKKLFPHAKIARMDHDTTRGKASHEALLSSFRRGDADILLGTQMVTKGHDFPKVTTVGVLNADASLYLDDYRANERTFSMLTQVIGRAGRAEDSGKSIIQTFNPTSDIIEMAASQDYKAFFENEIRIRRSLTFPPFCDIALITISSADETRLSAAAVRMGEKIRDYIRSEYTDVKAIIYGPFEAPVYKVQNVCRLRFIIKCRLNRRTREFISSLLGDFSKNGSSSRGGSSLVRVTADLNPTTI